MPAPIEVERHANSLWRPGSRAFLKDQRAAEVGDILTVVIEIDDSATISNTTRRTRDNEENASLTNFLGFESHLSDLFPDEVDPTSLVDMDYAGANSDVTVLEESFSLMKSALDGLSDLRGQIGANSKVLLKTHESHSDFLTFAENTASGIEDVDVAQATTEMSFAQVQLQGSYLALSRVSNLNLLQYL